MKETKKSNRNDDDMTLRRYYWTIHSQLLICILPVSSSMKVYAARSSKIAPSFVYILSRPTCVSDYSK